MAIIKQKMFGDIYYTNMLLYIEKEILRIKTLYRDKCANLYRKSKENKKIKDLKRERKEREREESFILITVQYVREGQRYNIYVRDPVRIRF